MPNEAKKLLVGLSLLFGMKSLKQQNPIKLRKKKLESLRLNIETADKDLAGVRSI